MIDSNFSPVIFPDPEKRGIIMEPVCWDLELHIWRLLLDHIASGQPFDLQDTTMTGFQDKQSYTNQAFPLTNSKFKTQTVSVTGDTPGVITHRFPTSGNHIMRGILGGTKRIQRTRMLESLQKRQIPEDKQAILIPEIERSDDLWFMHLFMTMLTQVGVGLSVKEREQLMANIEWFAGQYQK